MPNPVPRLSLETYPEGLAPTFDRAMIIREVEKGLPNEADRIKDASENDAIADLQGQFFIPRREAETEFDYAARLKQVTGLTHQVVNRLCAYTYNPGPMRTVVDTPAAEQVLQDIYESVHIDGIMADAERLATVADVACIQVTVPTDEEERECKPIDLQVWGSDEFAVFLDPSDQRKPVAVVVIDRYDEHTRYRLWFADEVRTFTTEKLQQGKTEGGVIAHQIGPTEVNPYGCLPFAFVHYRSPNRRFWCNGIGTFVRRSEEVLNGQVSELAESIQKYGKPIGIFVNVDPMYNPEIGPGRFLRLPRAGSAYEGDGFGPPGEPDAKYLQAELAIESIWSHITATMGQVAEAVDLPASALRLDYSDAPSGISIIVKTVPLLERARGRRPIFQRAECCLAKVMLRVYGTYYRKPELVEAAKKLKLLLAWPEPKIPVPGPDRDQCDAWEIGLGIRSRIMVISERYGLTRDQAIAHLKQVAADETEAVAILPKPEPEEGEKPEGDGPGKGDDE